MKIARVNKLTELQSGDRQSIEFPSWAHLLGFQTIFPPVLINLCLPHSGFKWIWVISCTESDMHATSMSTHREKSLTQLLIWGHEWGRCSSVTLAFVLCPSTATLVGGPNVNDEGDVQSSESLVSLSGPSEDGFPDWSTVVTGASPQWGHRLILDPCSPNCDMLPSGKLWNRVVAKQFNHRAASLPSSLPPHHQINEQRWALQGKPHTLQCFHSCGWRLQNQFRVILLLDQCLFLLYLWKKTWISKEDNLTFQAR